MSTSSLTITLESVIDAIHEVTRYPREVLQPDALLEDTLGIDSLKRMEVWGALERRFPTLHTTDTGVEASLTSSEADALTKVRTITDLAGAIAEIATRRRDRTDTSSRRDVHHPGLVGTVIDVPHPTPIGQIEAAVQRSSRAHPPRLLECAELLDRPAAALIPDANLEDDLGLAPEQVRAALARTLDGRSPPTLPATVGELLDLLNGPGPRESANGARPAGVGLDARAFAGKVVLVSGSGHGVGRAIAMMLAEAGATLVVNSFHSRLRGEATTREILDHGGTASHVWGSVAKEDHLRRMFDEIDRTHGGLDFFVSNASNGALLPLRQITAQYWERAFRTNVIALQQASLMASDLMRRRGGGKIVALSTVLAHRVVEHCACMGAVKAALESLTRYLAIELAPENIDVFCISAGPVSGELLNERWPRADEFKRAWLARMPHQRFLSEDDYARIVATHLALPSGLFTGQTIVADGGALLRA